MIEQLYRVFSRYALPARMVFCDYCDTAEYEESLHAELSTMPAELVDKYTWDAMHHTGNQLDFRHFVPRIYQLLWRDELPFADPEMVIGRLAHADWQDWSAAEHDSVRGVLDGLWDDAMRRQAPPVDIDSLVCGLGLAFRGVPPHVENWTTDNRPLAAPRLVEFVLANASELPEQRLGDPWWEQGREAMEALVTWLLTPRVAAFLRASAEATQDTHPETSEAVRLLDSAAAR